MQIVFNESKRKKFSENNRVLYAVVKWACFDFFFKYMFFSIITLKKSNIKIKCFERHCIPKDYEKYLTLFRSSLEINETKFWHNQIPLKSLFLFLFSSTFFLAKAVSATLPASMLFLSNLKKVKHLKVVIRSRGQTQVKKNS